MDDNSYKDFIPKIFKYYNDMYKNEIDLVYNVPKNKDELNLFGYLFVKNNMDLWKIVYENKDYELTDIFKCKDFNKDFLNIKLKGINNVSDLSYIFQGCSDLSPKSDFSNLDTTYCIKMQFLFYDCKFEELPDISKFNTCNVTRMGMMFSDCSSLKSLPDISNWNTSKVREMYFMFRNYSSVVSLLDIEKWDITYALKMKETLGMFQGYNESLNIP